MSQFPIGVFDSGFGGLTVLKDLRERLPDMDFIYLGDNARAPYGPLPFDTVYRYTLEAVKWFFEQNCPLVILACNTASAKALRSIQQNDLPLIGNEKRVLGVIRPTSEIIGAQTGSKHIGILATAGTVQSRSYILEIEKFSPETQIVQQACPEWVELAENGLHHSAEADGPIKRHLDELLAQDPAIDCILLACTHYPLLLDKIRSFTPVGIEIIEQGPIVAASLQTYLLNHPEISDRCSRRSNMSFYTTGSVEAFNRQASVFFGSPIEASNLKL